MERAGEHIRNLRLNKGLTQNDLADLLNTAQERISRIENGRIQMSADEYLEAVELLKSVRKVGSFTYNGPALAIGS